MKKTIDTSGLECPKPVLKTKEALSDGIEELIVIVDNPAAKENVSRFVEKQGYSIQDVKSIGSKFEIHVKGHGDSNAEAFNEDDYQCAIPISNGKAVFINSNCVGRGDDELGKNLMKAFIFSLNEVDNIPESILFMNSGVKLCVEGAETLENLQNLESKGIEILVCGTCLNFFGIAEKLKVGKVSNMYDIASVLTSKATLTI